MLNARVDVPYPKNEPIKSYAPGSPEKLSIKKRLKEMKEEKIEIPLIIGGKEIWTGNTMECIIPHDHKKVVGIYHLAGEEEVKMAMDAAMEAQKSWSETSWENRLSIFLKAADLLAGPWRDTINAACMLTHSKNVFQAEIDAACELIDFFKFNAYFATQIFNEQPLYSPDGLWNCVDYRPLEGFIFAVTPFNFVSIAGNLPSAPAMLGNVAVWKPASNVVYSAYYTMKLFEEAGLPPGVINFVPGPGKTVGPQVMESPDLAGIHFTGSTNTFQNMWKTVGNNIDKYKSYPRIVGETGGKDFIVAHKSSDPKIVATAMLRGSFEYQGQKCSASSRSYIPESLWPSVKNYLMEDLKTVKMGDVENFTNFINAVIDKKAFDTISGYIDYAKESKDAEIISGGGYDDSVGYFIEPTVIVTSDPHFKTMEEEIFGPVLTIYVYKDNDFEKTLKICDETSPYALTGAIFAKDKDAVITASRILVNSAGNFYINDKPTGAVVGQQPFGGSRASGTNDKAGSKLNLLRWLSPRTIKENFVPPSDYRYTFMNEK